MKYALSLLLFFLLCAGSNAQQTSSADIRKLEARSACNIHPVKVAGGVCRVSRFEQRQSEIELKQQRMAVPDFYLNRYEVSVADYLQFYRTMQDSTADTSYRWLYPDTLCFFTQNVYLYSEPACQVYFWHPKFQSCPIVGVSKQNALAYCKWLEQTLRAESVKILGKDMIKAVRLPTQAEWRLAAGDPDTDSLVQRYIKSGYCNLNTGNIVTEGGQFIAPFDKDGYLLGGPVNEGEKNRLGIYNLLGNVAEYTADSFRVYHEGVKLSKKLVFDPKDTLSVYNKHIYDSLLALEENGKTYELFVNRHLFKRDKEIIVVSKDEGFDGKLSHYDVSLIHSVITGASWNDDLRFLNPKEIRILHLEDRNAWTGFRYVIEYR